MYNCSPFKPELFSMRADNTINKLVRKENKLWLPYYKVVNHDYLNLLHKLHLIWTQCVGDMRVNEREVIKFIGT